VSESPDIPEKVEKEHALQHGMYETHVYATGNDDVPVVVRWWTEFDNEGHAKYSIRLFLKREIAAQVATIVQPEYRPKIGAKTVPADMYDVVTRQVTDLQRKCTQLDTECAQLKREFVDMADANAQQAITIKRYQDDENAHQRDVGWRQYDTSIRKYLVRPYTYRSGDRRDGPNRRFQTTWVVNSVRKGERRTGTERRLTDQNEGPRESEE
jgi:hypothetical protein